MPTQINYKGAMLASFTGTTKTMYTSGKYLEDDITITDTSSPYLVIINIEMDYSLASIGLSWISSAEVAP